MMSSTIAGVKRPRETLTSGDDVRFVKRFNLLEIDSKLKLNLSNRTFTSQESSSDNSTASNIKLDRTIINDLDAELSEIAAYELHENQPTFIEEIERQLAPIPKFLLRPPDSLRPSSMNQLVLYAVPKSISVPTEMDGVHRAIADYRQRIQTDHFPSSPLPHPLSISANRSSSTSDDKSSLTGHTTSSAMPYNTSPSIPSTTSHNIAFKDVDAMEVDD